MWYFSCAVCGFHVLSFCMCLWTLLDKETKTPHDVRVTTLASVFNAVTVVAFGFLLFGM